jgi:two-component system nitrate/nitrite response regulator NarL
VSEGETGYPDHDRRFSEIGQGCMVGTSSSCDDLGVRQAQLPHGDMLVLVDGDESPKGGGRRVLIIDNNLLTAESVAVALTQLDFNARFALPASSEHLCDFGTWQPHVALLDIDSVDIASALGCIRSLGAANVPIAVVTSSVDTPLAGESVHAGAISVVHKRAPLALLVETLLRILDGGEVMAEPLKRHLLERRGRLAAFEILTHREKYVLSQVMEGHSSEAIARGSCVSISTVRSQVKAILQKLGVNSQLAAAALARQVGWTYEAPQECGLHTANGDSQSALTERQAVPRTMGSLYRSVGPLPA